MKINDNRVLFYFFIILLSTVPMFSTDMYLPALPNLAITFGVPLKLVNLTLIVFFISFASASLIWGTLSDKYGRKPILIVSLSAYAASSFLCALAQDIYQLIGFRILQGVGGGAAMALSMAIVKDVFAGRARERMLVFQSSMMSIAPVVAPIMGAGILRIATWRGTFFVLGLFGSLLLIGSLLLREPAALDRNHQKTLRNTFSSLKRLALSPGFALPLGLFAIAGIPILMFVGGASDIYITGFGLSEHMFSLFFGFNAAFYTLGPFVYIWLARHFSVPNLIGLSFVLSAASGLLVIVFGHQAPYLFALAVVPYALGCGINRPPGMNILLIQGKQDTGAASSLANFTFLVTGCLGIFLISLDWDNRIFILGLAYMLTGVFALLFWPSVWNKCNPALISRNQIENATPADITQ